MGTAEKPRGGDEPPFNLHLRGSRPSFVCVRVVELESLSRSGPILSCEECSVELAADSPSLRLLLTSNAELLTYCAECWRASSRKPDGVVALPSASGR